MTDLGEAIARGENIYARFMAVAAGLLREGVVPRSYLSGSYIHRTGEPLAPQGICALEARGIAAILNSQIYDQYIRMVSGTTQVSATELRALPMPRLPWIEQLGRRDDERAEALLARILALGE